MAKRVSTERRSGGRGQLLRETVDTRYVEQKTIKITKYS